MFLKLLNKRRLHTEEGSALIAVIGVMAVLAIITVTVASTTTQALGVSTLARATVQSHSSAEAGIDVATVALKTLNGCTDASGVFDTTAGPAPRYRAVVAYDEGAGWVNGCPTAASTHVRVLSTGFAQAKGVAGVSAGDEVVLEAIFTYDPIIVQVPIAGSAVYAHTIVGTLKKFELDSADNSVATSVTIKTGDVSCSNNAKIGGDLILGAGNADLNMCTISGMVSVNGNVVANASSITGSIHATGNATVTNSTVGGDVLAGGFATASPTQVTGQIRSGAAVTVRPIPNWTDVPSDPAYWTAASYQVVNWTGPCTITDSTAEWASITNYTIPTAINFQTACPTSVVTTNNNVGTAVILKTDIALIGNQFKFDKLRLDATSDRVLTVIVPDNVVNDVPDCAPPSGLSGDIELTNETDFGTKIAAMVYTPCKVYSDRDGFRGQMYGGEVEFRQQASLEFKAVGIPGADLTDGLTTSVVTGMQLGDRLSLREAASGG